MKHVSWLNLEIQNWKHAYYIFIIFLIKCSTKEAISLFLRRAPCTEPFIIFSKVLYKGNYQLLLSQSTLYKAFYGRYTFQNIPLQLIFGLWTWKSMHIVFLWHSVKCFTKEVCKTCIKASIAKKTKILFLIKFCNMRLQINAYTFFLAFLKLHYQRSHHLYQLYIVLCNRHPA